MPLRKTKVGFTLLEVTLSLIILGMSLVVIYQVFSNTLMSSTIVSSRQADNIDLRFLKQQLLKEPRLSEVQNGGNIVTPDQKEWTWKANVSPTKVLDLYKVTITLIDLNRSSRQLSQTFYLLRPTWTSPSKRQTILEQLKNDED